MAKGTGHPLPDVIDPGEFECIRVWYPADPGYRRAVMGALAYLQHWFAWARDDEKRGKDAAAVYREAFGLTVNDILAGRGCGDDSDNGDLPSSPGLTDEDLACLGGLIVLESEDDMGQVVTDLKIEDGKLVVYYGPCCRVELGDWCCDVSPNAPSDDDSIPVPDPPPTGYDCYKAHTVVTLIQSIAAACWDVTGVVNFVLTPLAPGLVDNQFPAFDLDNWSLFGALQTYYLAKLAGIWVGGQAFSEWYPETMWQRIICSAKAQMSDAATFTQAEWDAIKAAIAQHEVTDIFQKEALMRVYDSLGYDQAKMAAEQSYYGDAPDCACPDAAFEDEYSTPNSSGWYLSDPIDVYTVTYVNESGAERHLLIDVTPDHDVFGAVFTYDTQGVLNWKIMDANSVEPTIQDWGLDTSGNEYDYKTRVCWGPGTLWNLLFGSGAYYHLGEGNLDSITPETPATEGLAGAQQGLAAESVFNHGGTITVSQLRLLHNTNSPSHSS